MIRGDKGWDAEARTRSMKSEKCPFNLCIQRLDHFYDVQYITLLIYALKQT